MSEMRQPLVNLNDDLERDGYAILRAVIDREMTAELRAEIDRITPPVERNGAIHERRHPMDIPTLARLAVDPGLLEVARHVLKVSDLDDLRLLEQVLIRTDPSPPPPRPTGWHVDWGFKGREFDESPRGSYFNFKIACCPVPLGAGNTRVIPGSHKLTRRKMEDPDAIEQIVAGPLAAIGGDESTAIDAILEEGDMLIFDPMTLHSGSTNSADVPRYVCFTSYFFAGAAQLLEGLVETGSRPAFPPTFSDISPKLATLVS